MANPPFNVDEVDAEKVKNDPRLPYSLPGVNKKGKVSNGNYLWISYFDSYLNENGRAGFVMSSQASSAGGKQGKVRRKLIEAGHVDVMIAVRSGFFYTRTVPRELWFLDKDKPEEQRGKVLMIDARNVHRKVTRKIYDFTPEQQKNLSAIVWLYRGQTDRFLALVADYFASMIEVAGQVPKSLGRFLAALNEAVAAHADDGDPDNLAEIAGELNTAKTAFKDDADQFRAGSKEATAAWERLGQNNDSLKAFAEETKPLSDACGSLIQLASHLYELMSRLMEAVKKRRGSPLKSLDDARMRLVDHLEDTRYFHRQADWLQERFPRAALRDVEGLVKLVDIEEIEENDCSLTPGRYVGVAREYDDENFDFMRTMRELHDEVDMLHVKAAELALKIARNFGRLSL